MANECADGMDGHEYTVGFQELNGPNVEKPLLSAGNLSQSELFLVLGPAYEENSYRSAVNRLPRIQPADKDRKYSRMRPSVTSESVYDFSRGGETSWRRTHRDCAAIS
jgi:hypothetical protein